MVAAASKSVPLQLAEIVAALNTALGVSSTLSQGAVIKAAYPSMNIPAAPGSTAGTYTVPTFTIKLGTIETVVPALTLSYDAITMTNEQV